MATPSISSAQIVYPLHPLPQGPQPIVLQSINSRAVIVDEIILEKVGKSGTNQTYSGYIFFSSSMSLLPLQKYRFELEKGKRRFCI